ncbi:MAG: hypothetical protein KAX05_15555 [Bacteroidales bacterium]|nr:hypothetical protein [Bacteroidales bacterium]
MKRTKVKKKRWTDGVLKDARKQREQDIKTKQGQQQAFERRYNKLRIYKRSSNINMEQFVYLPKFIDLPFYEGINTAALAIYPVVCCAADFEQNEWLQLSQEHIARMAGVSINTVRKGIDNLVYGDYYITEDDIDIPLLEKKKVTEGTRHFYMYRVGFIRRDMIKGFREKYFSFHRCIITSGVWASLMPRAKALYLAMRTKAQFDAQLYMEIEYDEPDMSGADFDFKSEQYRNRKWDPCIVPLAELCRMVNIERANIKPVIKQLEHCGLVEKIGNYFKVYLKPSIMVRH